MNIYSGIFISSIYTAKNNGFMSDVWKFTCNFYFSAALAGNLILLFVAINRFLFSNHLYFLIPRFIGNNKYDFLINWLFVLTIPIMIFNYFRYLHQEKYLIEIRNGKSYYSKKAFAIYFAFTFFFLFLFLFSTTKFVR